MFQIMLTWYIWGRSEYNHVCCYALYLGEFLSRTEFKVQLREFLFQVNYSRVSTYGHTTVNAFRVTS